MFYLPNLSCNLFICNNLLVSYFYETNQLYFLNVLTILNNSLLTNTNMPILLIVHQQCLKGGLGVVGDPLIFFQPYPYQLFQLERGAEPLFEIVMMFKEKKFTDLQHTTKISLKHILFFRIYYPVKFFFT